MCNERENGVWYIHGAKSAGCADNKSGTPITGGCADKTTISEESVKSDSSLAILYDNNQTATISCTTAFYSKDEHDENGVGSQRCFDTTLIDDIDRAFKSKWALPEYLPFREMVKMAIQDGIIAGMERAAKKYEPMLDGKDKEITKLNEELSFWRRSFTGLLRKCKEGVEAFEFISKVVHLSGKRQ